MEYPVNAGTMSMAKSGTRDIPDAKLRAVIESALGKEAGTATTVAERWAARLPAQGERRTWRPVRPC